MTVTSDNKKSGPFVGPGPTFTYDFDIYLDSDVEVTHTDSAGLNTTKVLITDYTVNRTTKVVTVVGTFATNLTSSDKITMRPALPQTQLQDLKNQGAWDPEQHEQMFDRLVIDALRQQEEIDRCYKVKVGEVFDPTSVTADFYNQRPRLLSEHVAPLAGSGIEELEVYVDNTSAYDMLRLEIPIVQVLGVSANRTLALRIRQNDAWISASDYRYAMKVLDSGGTAANHVSASVNVIRLTLVNDFDRDLTGSWYSGVVEASSRLSGSHTMSIHGQYADSVAGEELTMMVGSAYVQTFAGDIQGFQVFTDGLDHLVGTLRLWGLPKA
jgi:hypothetical protein